MVLSFGILAIVAVRGFTRGEQLWDLVGLVLLGGVVNAGYQVRHRVVYRRWMVLAAATAAAAALLSALLVLLRR
ncbi:MAG: hypothetical protein HY824_01845 [Acidobacteria bacterium]|nr:hypothetical protein [Acidobacteriota bacterium]